MENIFGCNLYVCNNPSAKFNDKMTNHEKITSALKSSDCNYRYTSGPVELYGYFGTMNIICKKTIPIVKKNKVNYATEILTGVRIPIIGMCGYILNGPVFGKVKTPYYAETTLGNSIRVKNWLFYIPNGICSFVNTDMLNEYIEKHIDEDGTFNSYKKELEELIQNSIEEFKNIKTTEYVIEESVSDIYKQIKRTRRR
ncbi:MAG: hypothetical protein IKX00_02085 [Bacilli bacterium]|nr:hypothetical protein [Bacilli bacterium]